MIYVYCLEVSMRLDLQKNILAIVQRVTLCTIQILVELNNYQIMSRLIYLGGSLLIMLASFYPLLSLIKALGNVREISTLAIGLIVVWLVVALIFGLLLFYFTWNDIIEEEEEKYIQLHFKGTVYTVPEIYQVKGLHNSSSLYKITHYSTLGRVLAVSKKGVKTRRKTAIWTCSSAGQSNRLIIWRSQVQTLAGPQEGRGGRCSW